MLLHVLTAESGRFCCKSRSEPTRVQCTVNGIDFQSRLWLPSESQSLAAAPQGIIFETPSERRSSENPSRTFATWGNSGSEPHQGTRNQLSRKDEAHLMGPPKDGGPKWNTMSDWTCR